MIPNDFIQTLLGRVDIVELIDRYVPLKKAGANYSACCPFHSEKSPSFTVSPTKQFYHCFGCGAHGTAVGFLMEYGGKTFPDAIEELARDAGLDVPREERAGEIERREEAADLSEILAMASRFYKSALKDSPRAIEYLKRRGLTGEIAARFALGYAPDGWQSLEKAFTNYANPALDAAGLVIKGDNDRRYDRFRDRVMFPIHDSRGRVIGFGGRVIDQGEPKYLNSPETAVFSKGRELYGLFQARAAIREAGKVVVVEGYMDVVALAQHGVGYAVATLGTSTTPVHVQKLFRQADTVVFCFDGDAAGQRAAWRALENALPALADGKNASFLFLPDGDDPDDYIRKHGRAAFESAVAGATPLSEYLIAELSARHPPVSAEGQAALAHAARDYIGAIHAPLLGALLRKRLADLTGLAETQVAALVPAATAPLPPPTPGHLRDAQRPTRMTRPAKATLSLTQRLLYALLLKPSVALTVDVPQPDDGTPAGAALAAALAIVHASSNALTTQAVVQQMLGTTHESVVFAALAATEAGEISDEQAEAEWRDGAARWTEQRAARETGRLLATPLEQMSADERAALRQRLAPRQG